MEPTEIEKSVGDLEVAVDRLRSLYEQYFMGIEKLEPTVPRKDVDRRIYALRKEQIRNTAMRFRFQMILQRYNVYQTHWQRICREIENGTYKRHMLRAERRFGEEGQGRKRRTSTLPPPGAPPARDLAKELAELDAEFAPPPQEMDLDDADLMLEVEAPRGPAAPAVSRQLPTSAQTPGQLQERKGPVWRKVDPAPPRHSSPPPPRPLHPGIPRAQPIPAAPKVPGPVPGPARAPAPPAPAPAPARGPAPPAPRTTSEDLPEARVRQIYSQYVEAKRRGNESTAAITYEAVAKSLRRVERQAPGEDRQSRGLRGRHEGRKGDPQARHQVTGARASALSDRRAAGRRAAGGTIGADRHPPRSRGWSSVGCRSPACESRGPRGPRRRPRRSLPSAAPFADRIGTRRGRPTALGTRCCCVSVARSIDCPFAVFLPLGLRPHG